MAASNVMSPISRADFGEEFIFGSASSAYQDGYARYPKESALWFMNFLNKTNGVGELSRPTKPTKRALDDGELEANAMVEENPKKKVLKV